MQPVFFEEGPAVLIERNKRSLVIADPHFGVEADLHRRGLHFQSGTKGRLDRLLSLIEESEPDYLVVLGDLKHMIAYVTHQEKTEMPFVLEKIRELTEFRLAPGNHDTGLEHYLKRGELLSASGELIDGTGYFHGHTVPSSELFGHLILCGHHHPTVNIYDSVGCALRGTPGYLLAEIDTTQFGCKPEGACPDEGANFDSAAQAQIKDDAGNKTTRVLLVPAFYELAGGIDVRLIPARNSSAYTTKGASFGRAPRSQISPIAKAIKTETAEIFLKDGTYMGKLEELRPDPNELAGFRKYNSER